MLEADALTLHDVDAHGRAVEQQIDDMIVEQVDLVDIEDAAIGRGQNARFEVSFASLNRFLDVERTDHAIFGGADGQVDKRRRAAFAVKGACLLQHLARVVIKQIGPGRIAVEHAAAYDLDLGQEGGKGTRRRGLCGATFAANQHAADLWVDGVQKQCTFHALLADDGGERIRQSHEFFLT